MSVGLCTACLKVEHVDARTPHFDRVSDVEQLNCLVVQRNGETA